MQFSLNSTIFVYQKKLKRKIPVKDLTYPGGDYVVLFITVLNAIYVVMIPLKNSFKTFLCVAKGPFMFFSSRYPNNNIFLKDRFLFCSEVMASFPDYADIKAFEVDVVETWPQCPYHWVSFFLLSFTINCSFSMCVTM